MARLDEIAAKLGDQAGPEVDMETMPEESAGFRPTPFPGDYAFQLPAELDFDTREIKTKDAEGNLLKDDKGENITATRLVTVFGDGHELKIVEAEPVNQDFVGEAVRYRVSNAEYRYGKDRELVSEMGFLMRALGEIVPKGSGNVAWAQAISKHALGRFRATIEWDAFCDPDRKRYVWSEAENKNVEDNKTGCGQRYGQRAYKKNDGTQVVQIPEYQDQMADGTVITRFHEQIACACGAQVRCFPRLRSYRPFDQPVAG